MKAVKLILPGLFLLTLGAGNFGVGSFKSREYQQVLQDLSVLESSAVIKNASPLRRVQVAKVSADRLSARLSKAQHRRDFYNLVQFGGKCIIALSFVFLLPGLILSLRGRAHTSEPTATKLAQTDLPGMSLSNSPEKKAA
jgi:hypothetical protein